MLNQSEVAKYFDQCHNNSEIEEVLSAYIVWKFYRGHNPAQVLLKMHHPCCYLRVTGRSRILTIGYDAFKILTVEVALGGGRIGVLPSFTKPGLAVWNTLRQAASHSSSRKRKIVTDEIYGGPGPVLAFLHLSPSQPFSPLPPPTSSSTPIRL
ncbi:uncharacterized protein STEHIDRAFT_120069, partial [Stereum hirsutum FP-91666 SS1]|uniref:uncharacterized protein n=1 Tax=Stereum hirsutum (strain FP-91666) TaxID=721885 RepID=UPI000440B380